MITGRQADQIIAELVSANEILRDISISLQDINQKTHPPDIIERRMGRIETDGLAREAMAVMGAVEDV